MQQRIITFLRFVIYTIGLSMFAALLRFPLTEGRAVNLDLLNIYLDPLIIYSYIASIPFFIALSQALRLLTYASQNQIFTESALKAIRKIQYCAVAIIAFLITAIILIRTLAAGDDPAGPTMLGFIAITIAIAIAFAASLIQQILHNAISLKSENDLTV